MSNNAEKIKLLERKDIPSRLAEISDPPKKLYLLGEIPTDGFNLCVVGSRKPTPYGRQAVESLISGLSSYPINIVSGLAIGIDTLAHEAALKYSLRTIAVPGSGLLPEVLYPRSNKELARRILENNGALVSEFDPKFRATPWSFPKRNRIMAGLSDAILLIEAEIRSGTLITARLASDYNRDVLAVPGSIFSSNSSGTNMFLRLGAVPITSSKDILDHFGLETRDSERIIADRATMTADEISVFDYLKEPTRRADLPEKMNMESGRLNIALSLLEIKGLIQEYMGFLSQK